MRKTKYITIAVTPEIHQAIKLRATKERRTMLAYLTRLFKVGTTD